MLIRNAEINFSDIVDLRIAGAVVTDIGRDLQANPGEEMLEANGGALLPGLLDHHLHLIALASSLDSAPCGPPQVITADALAQSLLRHATDTDEWIRGIGYHESVAGDIDRDWLDVLLPSRPVRIQHRSGRLWILNSRALEQLDCGEDAPLEYRDGRATGRLYDADDWLREKLARKLPSLAQASQLLAGYGITGITDASPHNGPDEIRHFTAEQACGHLLQDVLAMGDARLDRGGNTKGVHIGARKILLREAELPIFDALCADIVRAHDAGRPVAIHSVTLVELVFALSALAAAGQHHGDRIEHASIAPPDMLPLLAGAGVTVVTQPNFIHERGDAYLVDVAQADQPWLYRGQGFLDAGIPLAAGTDAPFGNADPWQAMQTAVTRRTRNGEVIGASESMSPERALALFSGNPQAPGGILRRIEPSMAADLCLLDCPWHMARRDLTSVRVQATFKAGHFIWRRELAEHCSAPPKPDVGGWSGAFR